MPMPGVHKRLEFARAARWTVSRCAVCRALSRIVMRQQAGWYGTAWIANNCVMSTTLKIPPEFDAVPEGEQIAFVQELWDRIARDLDRVPIPDDHKRILDERLDAYRANPQTGQLWSEVREQLLAKLRSS